MSKVDYNCWNDLIKAKKEKNSVKMALYIIKRCEETYKPVSNLRLNKILFLIYGFYYNCFNQTLFSNSNFVAMKLGPIEKDVYLYFIDQISNDLEIKKYSFDEEFILNNYTGEELLFIDKMIVKFNSFTTNQLIELTQSFHCWQVASKYISKEMNSTFDYPKILSALILEDFKKIGG